MKNAEEFLAELAMKSGADLGIEPNPHSAFGESDSLSSEVKNTAELAKKIEAKAVALLAMREHGAKELKQKLLTKFPETSELLAEYAEQPGLVKLLVTDVLTLCQENNWQSDERYIEQAVRNYVDKGHGPQKIRQKLQQNCHDSGQISAALDWDESDWVELAQDALYKKYGSCKKPAEQKEQARCMRFLQSRGFSQSTIWKSFR
ncbi:regulatory protein RecX [Thiomicrorhabdus sp. Milos-T2]|uniref:regulatory protein RecX n=1 Tax=Thiomicrorhabdus sp. Milos-T2 TaxID=90814 RepID=UPI000493F182|nr:regulatory protein RecX [Thiomicrorhabdus sp. Milos-T2]